MTGSFIDLIVTEVSEEIAKWAKDMAHQITAAPPQSPHGKRIIKRFTRNGREYHFHATKGWRNYRAAPNGGTKA